MASDRQANGRDAVGAAVAQIERQFGKGSILRLGDKTRVETEVVPTGGLAIDAALGIGGVPRGRIVEIYGPEASGKTTLLLHIMAQAQRMGGAVAFIDAEHALDAKYARSLHVDTDSLLVSQPDYGEQALEIAEVLVRSGGLDVIAIDSVAALVPKAELEGQMGDSFVGLQARLMSQAMRKLSGITARSRTVLLFTNQIREKIGVMFGSPETTPGGRALKYYSSVRIDIRRIAALKEGDTMIGHRARAKIVKNKLSPPFREAEFDILYGTGISREGDLLDLGIANKLVEKSGSWFSFKDTRLGQGRENARAFLKENADVAATVEREIRAKLEIPVATAADSAAQPEPEAPLRARPAAAGDARGRRAESAPRKR